MSLFSHVRTMGLSATQQVSHRRKHRITTWPKTMCQDLELHSRKSTQSRFKKNICKGIELVSMPVGVLLMGKDGLHTENIGIIIVPAFSCEDGGIIRHSASF